MDKGVISWILFFKSSKVWFHLPINYNIISLLITEYLEKYIFIHVVPKIMRSTSSIEHKNILLFKQTHQSAFVLSMERTSFFLSSLRFYKIQKYFLCIFWTDWTNQSIQFGVKHNLKIFRFIDLWNRCSCKKCWQSIL